MELPDFVETKLKDAVKKTPGSTYESFLEEYTSVFEDDYIQTDDSFTDDESRHRYAMQVFWTRFVGRPPIKPYSVIPIGIDSVRKSKSTGVLNSALFILDKTMKLRRISLKGNISNIARTISLWSMYKDVSLGAFSDSADLQADDRAEFENPTPIDASQKDIIAKLNIPYVTVKSAKNNLSRVSSTGYVNKTDWRAIIGIVHGISRSKEDADSEWGVYHLRDDSIDADAKPRVTKDGRVITPGISSWLSPTLMKYAMYSECIFIGPTVKTKQGEIQQNCYCVIPIHPRYEGVGE